MNRFYWPDSIVPAVRTTQRQKYVDPAYKKYERFKRAFRLWANTQGFPGELDLKKSYGMRVEIKVIGKSRYDLDNAEKSALDALFKQDRRILFLEGRIFERQEKESATIEIWEIPE